MYVFGRKHSNSTCDSSSVSNFWKMNRNFVQSTRKKSKNKAQSKASTGWMHAMSILFSSINWIYPSSPLSRQCFLDVPPPWEWIKWKKTREIDIILFITWKFDIDRKVQWNPFRKKMFVWGVRGGEMLTFFACYTSVFHSRHQFPPSHSFYDSPNSIQNR